MQGYHVLEYHALSFQAVFFSLATKAFVCIDTTKLRLRIFGLHYDTGYRGIALQYRTHGILAKKQGYNCLRAEKPGVRSSWSVADVAFPIMASSPKNHR
jgi:hypothetical protein